MQAAAGNQGPGAPPAYPGAYHEVIAVTAVDRNLRPYLLANRGDYVDLAAPGVEIWTPDPRGGGRYRHGTSLATAFATAVMVERLARDGGAAPADLARALGRDAKDLGAPGKDPVFGWGLIQSRPRCPP